MSQARTLSTQLERGEGSTEGLRDFAFTAREDKSEPAKFLKKC